MAQPAAREFGIPVGFHSTVADDLSDNVAVFRARPSGADLVLSTGGLGRRRTT